MGENSSELLTFNEKKNIIYKYIKDNPNCFAKEMYKLKYDGKYLFISFNILYKIVKELIVENKIAPRKVGRSNLLKIIE
jgi:predicted transcriptional regulator